VSSKAPTARAFRPVIILSLAALEGLQMLLRHGHGWKRDVLVLLPIAETPFVTFAHGYVYLRGEHEVFVAKLELEGRKFGQLVAIRVFERSIQLLGNLRRY